MKKIYYLFILIILVILSGCNLSGDAVLLINNTDYTVFFEYRDGAEGDGSDNMEIAEVQPNSNFRIDNIEMWGDELLYSGYRTEEDVDIKMDTIPGTRLWPLTLIFTEEE